MTRPEESISLWPRYQSNYFGSKRRIWPCGESVMT